MEKQKQKILNMPIPTELHKKLKLQATKEEVTIRELLIKIINAYFDGQK